MRRAMPALAERMLSECSFQGFPSCLCVGHNLFAQHSKDHRIRPNSTHKVHQPLQPQWQSSLFLNAASMCLRHEIMLYRYIYIYITSIEERLLNTTPSRKNAKGITGSGEDETIGWLWQDGGSEPSDILIANCYAKSGSSEISLSITSCGNLTGTS